MSILGVSFICIGIIEGLWGLKIRNNLMKLGAILLLAGGIVLASADSLLRPEDFGTKTQIDSP